MKASTTIALRLSEIRERLNTWPEDGKAEDEAALRAESTAKEVEYRAAIHQEEADAGTTRNHQDGESAELRRLRKEASLSNYVLASMARRGVTGAEAELNAALGMGELDFPLDLLAPEVRAAIDGDAETSQRTWLDAVFHDSAAMRLGITFPSVDAGIAAYPVTTAGPASAQQPRAGAQAAGTLAVAVKELKPTRHVTHGIYSIEDAARLPGLADAMLRHMRMQMVDDIDKAVFVGEDVGGTEADIAGLSTRSGVDETTITQANKIKADETLKAFADLIDGQYAASPADLRVVTAEGSNILWMTTIHNSAASNQTIAQFLRESGLGWTTRGDIETATLNGDFAAFVGLARGIEGAGVAPHWMNGTLITDPYTGAAKGEVAVTLTTLWAFDLPRPDNFKRLKFVT